MVGIYDRFGYGGVMMYLLKKDTGVPCERPLPLPLGEVAERSEDGEGKRRGKQCLYQKTIPN